MTENKQGELKQRLYKVTDEYALLISGTNALDYVLDEAKKEFLQIPLWTGNEPDALIKHLTLWFEKWFGAP